MHPYDFQTKPVYLIGDLSFYVLGFSCDNQMKEECKHYIILISMHMNWMNENNQPFINHAMSMNEAATDSEI